MWWRTGCWSSVQSGHKKESGENAGCAFSPDSFYEFQGASYHIGIKSDLIISFQIHKIVQIPVLIQILHVLHVNVCVLKLFRRAECFLNNASADDIL